ncbi:hypothetical protein [Streptomyces sp. NPDC058678]|uniref:hypothetical protein n=1 Tax=Streptomyces sp. NPDC058678 TaxID=3346595 RepID=UPI0036504A6E
MQSATIPAEIATARTGRVPFAVQAVAAVSDPVDQLDASTPADPFDAALDAIAAVFAASTDTDGDWLALRSAVNLYAGRDARTGEK